MPNKKGYKSHRKGISYIKEFGEGKSEEIKKKLSDSHKGQVHPYTGKKMPPEIAEKHIGQNKGRIPWNYVDGRSKSQPWNRYGSNWKKIRAAIFIRDNFTCKHCNIHGGLLCAHHIIPFVITKNNSLENLITLCSRCHKIEEARIIKELKNQEKKTRKV